MHGLKESKFPRAPKMAIVVCIIFWARGSCYLFGKGFSLVIQIYSTVGNCTQLFFTQTSYPEDIETSRAAKCVFSLKEAKYRNSQLVARHCCRQAFDITKRRKTYHRPLCSARRARTCLGGHSVKLGKNPDLRTLVESTMTNIPPLLYGILVGGGLLNWFG